MLTIYIVTISSNNNSTKTNKLILTLTQSIIYEVWLSRNKIKCDKIVLSHQTIINKINKQVQTIVTIHYMKYKTESALDKSTAFV